MAPVFGQNVQRTANHKQEGDNGDATLKALVDGSKEIQKACRLLCYIMEGSRVNDHFTSVCIKVKVAAATGDCHMHQLRSEIIRQLP